MADYGPGIVVRWTAALPKWRARLAAIEHIGWPQSAPIDWQLVEAEMNGLDFNLRVLVPWAREPSFYANIFADRSDVPAHEGTSAWPNIDLYQFTYPLGTTDAGRLTMMLAVVPAKLAAAKANFQSSNARDLWVYGDSVFTELSDTLAVLQAGMLKMRTLDGVKFAFLKGAGPELSQAAAAAKAATDDFALWVAAQTLMKTGTSRFGKPNYNWYVNNVDLNPYDWDQQSALLRRELDRSIASLRLEEVRNRNLPPTRPIEDAAAYRAMVAAKKAGFSDVMDATGLSTGEPYVRTAIANQLID